MIKSINILLAEDDKNLGFVIKDNLVHEGFNVTLCEDGLQAHSAFKRESFSLCVLDVMLPKMDGFKLAEQIRKTDKNIPILFLTAKSMVEDKLEGFKKGGDDYITKPFNMEELIYRINVFLKRTSSTKGDKLSYKIGNYTFDYNNLTLTVNFSTQKLTQKEADVLQLFCDHQGEVLKREYILKQIWGSDDYFLGRSLDVFISKIRKYLKKDRSINIINYHGIGFKFTDSC
ncbi:MAG: response regulator transcription factor [Cyclobacteriaceae bacterium]|nr:response regulator transcription factor [Cyclobacteriaceae bacterium]